MAALEQWPESGVPDNPGAWLMATAKHRAIDQLRRNERLERKHAELGRELDGRPSEPDLDAALDDDVERRPAAAGVHGLPPGAVARGARRADAAPARRPHHRRRSRARSCVPEPTVAQRIVRAKRTLSEARVPFEVPRGRRARRAPGVGARGVYLVFNEGYSATAGDDWMRPALCDEALRLGRILAELVPDEPEVHGLVALMEMQASRLRARVGAGGEPVLLLDQDRARWDQRADRPRPRRRSSAPRRSAARSGPYALQAAIAACHARARTADGDRLAAHRRALRRARAARAVAGRRAQPGGRRRDGVRPGGRAWRSSTRWPPSRRSRATTCCRACAATCSRKLGRDDEARAEFERAAALTRNERERALLLARANSTDRRPAESSADT